MRVYFRRTVISPSYVFREYFCNFNDIEQAAVNFVSNIAVALSPKALGDMVRIPEPDTAVMIGAWTESYLVACESTNTVAS
ncbi:hypothetical protein D3C73_1358980 [compost metagenome]